MTEEEALQKLEFERKWLLDAGYNAYNVDIAFDSIRNIIKVLCEVPAIPIPANATNKDMFKAIFGYEPATDAVVCNKDDWCGASEPCNYCTCNSNIIGEEEKWWNAPYVEESGDNE